MCLPQQNRVARSGRIKKGGRTHALQGKEFTLHFSPTLEEPAQKCTEKDSSDTLGDSVLGKTSEQTRKGMDHRGCHPVGPGMLESRAPSPEGCQGWCPALHLGTETPRVGCPQGHVTQSSERSPVEAPSSRGTLSLMWGHLGTDDWISDPSPVFPPHHVQHPFQSADDLHVPCFLGLPPGSPLTWLPHVWAWGCGHAILAEGLQRLQAAPDGTPCEGG